ncbi:MAG TPA: hypothetical protein VMD77_06025 [Candidatus Baltobacteraceae bacterium]|nr:hypothetical protein [Candidatus Baltobacteraceae bacterium]
MGVRRLETLRQFQIDLFGFSALDVNGCLEATFDIVGKGHQSKRHEKPRHRQPESAASGATASLQAWHYHLRGRFAKLPLGITSTTITARVGGNMFEFYDEAKLKNVCTVPFVPNLSSGAVVGARKNIGQRR